MKTLKGRKQHTVSQKKRILVAAEQSGNIADTCHQYGITRDTIYRWKKQFEAGGKANLERKKRKATNHAALNNIRLVCIIALKWPALGPKKIKEALLRKYSITLSSSRIYNILKFCNISSRASRMQARENGSPGEIGIHYVKKITSQPNKVLFYQYVFIDYSTNIVFFGLRKELDISYFIEFLMNRVLPFYKANGIRLVHVVADIHKLFNKDDMVLYRLKLKENKIGVYINDDFDKAKVNAIESIFKEEVYGCILSDTHEDILFDGVQRRLFDWTKYYNKERPFIGPDSYGRSPYDTFAQMKAAGSGLFWK